MKTIVKNEDGQFFYISTEDTFDRGPETMAFPCTETGHVTDWRDLDVEHYQDMSEAESGHIRMCNKFGTPISKDGVK